MNARRIFVALALSALSLTPVWGEDKTARPWTADSDCGNRAALTAVSQLGPVRIVVYDPLSNSFGFVAPCADDVETEAYRKNREYLDRNRLALTTQKIRLLIMPYNPADGALSLATATSEGVEFDAMAVAGVAAPASAPEDEEDDDSEQALSPGLRASVADALDRAESSRARPTPADETLRRADEAWNQLKALVERLRTLRAQARHLRTAVACVDRHLASVPARLSAGLASERLSLAGDTTLAEVVRVAAARSGLFTRVSYDRCPELVENDRASSRAPTTNGELMERDFAALARRLGDLEAELDDLATSIEQDLASEVKFLEGRAAPVSRSVTTEEWAEQLADFRAALGDLRERVDALRAGTQDLALRIDGLPSKGQALETLLHSPASQLQRFNYNPLRENEAITFTIRRGEKREGDGDLPAIPERVNTTTLKSAPVYTARLGTGVVVSRLERPRFGVGPEREIPAPTATEPLTDGEPPTEGEEPATIKVKQVLLEDDGDGEVFPVLFVHNYWMRRSPLLTPTRFERFVPTVSLGIPMAKSEFLAEILLGLDWELVPGVELNVGLHFGEVDRLTGRDAFDQPLVVDGDILSSVDVTQVTAERFTSDVYFGVVLTSEIFDNLLSRRK